MAGDDTTELETLIQGNVSIAFSGGGIRSATISLGIAQAFAQKGKLDKIKVISTVSGGGYFGAFLKSLYLPSKDRGIDQNGVSEASTLIPQNVLACDPDVRSYNKTDTNEPRPDIHPIQWLRKHSRFLAPNGTADYWTGAAILSRNWLGMIYMFMLAIGMLMTVSIWVQIGVWQLIAFFYWQDNPAALFQWPSTLEYLEVVRRCGVTCALSVKSGNGFLVSAWFWLATFGLVLNMLVGAAYWYTEAIDAIPVGNTNNNKSTQSLNASFLRSLLYSTILTFFAILAVLAFIFYIDDIFSPLNGLLSSIPSVHNDTWLYAILVAVFIASSIFCAWFAWFQSRPKTQTNALRVAVMRNKLSRWSGTLLFWSVVVAGFAVIDTLALNLRQQLNNGEFTIPTISAAAATTMAFVVHKLSKLEGENAILNWLGKHATIAALLLAIILWGILAVLVDTLAHAAFWKETPWIWGNFEGWTALIFSVALITLFGLTIISDGFVNHSSLHGLYASRLTRAYLGGTNTERLSKSSASFVETHPRDYIDAETYFSSKAGPEHIVNIAVNETVDSETGLAERDRMAKIFSLGQDGIRYGIDEHWDWKKLREEDSESLSVGQWIAISGAAVASGMGRFNSAGGALLLTFANARLGYWWRKDKKFHMVRLLGPLRYLWSEMFCYYNTKSKRLYLSDGGHIDNSAVYGLLMRYKTKYKQNKFTDYPSLIIATDNGSDAKYKFEDLEQLVRRARLDLGFEISIANGDADFKNVSDDKIACFLNRPSSNETGEDNWRRRAASPIDTGFALLLFAKDTAGHKLPIVWLKPCRHEGMSADVAGYAAANPSFPQESTINQFFDEEQFESYRKLGEEMMSKLLA